MQWAAAAYIAPVGLHYGLFSAKTGLIFMCQKTVCKISADEPKKKRYQHSRVAVRPCMVLAHRENCYCTDDLIHEFEMLYVSISKNHIVKNNRKNVLEKDMK